MHAANVMPVVAAERIDHATRPTAPEPGVTIEYGKYLATSCRFCHGETLGGGKPPDPNAPAAPNIGAGSVTATWSEADFLRTIRTGTTPYGRHLTDAMPWKTFARLTDDELRAIWMYVRSVQQQPRRTARQ